jgi:hypothetical protein
MRVLTCANMSGNNFQVEVPIRKRELRNRWDTQLRGCQEIFNKDQIRHISVQ